MRTKNLLPLQSLVHMNKNNTGHCDKNTETIRSRLRRKLTNHSYYN